MSITKIGVLERLGFSCRCGARINLVINRTRNKQTVCACGVGHDLFKIRGSWNRISRG